MALLSNHTNKHRPPYIVELVGPAGAGKTTLSHVLNQRDGRIQIGAEIELHKLKHILIFLAYVPLLLPVILRRYQHSRCFNWDEIKFLVYLKAWPRFLRQQTSKGDSVILLDHGPVFKLATLNAFGPKKLKSKGLEEWWNNMFKQWASILDKIIWLDASDTNLLKRINTRDQRHAVKGRSENDAYKFLARYRSSYENILAKMTNNKDSMLIKFDTSQTSIQQIADEVLITCNNLKLRKN